MREVWLRKNPPLSASRMQTSETPGMRPSRSKLIPTRISKAAQTAQDLDALDGTFADIAQIIGEVFGGPFCQRCHQNAPPFPRWRQSSIVSSI
jgi:hypothetical protein